jgi:hypothetical protein
MIDDDGDDLLEIYDDNKAPEFDYFAEQKEKTGNFVYFLIMMGFLVCIAIKFFQSLPGNGPDEDAIVIRQVQLLKIIQDSKNEQLVQSAAQEYDSLANVLQEIENPD